MSREFDGERNANAELFENVCVGVLLAVAAAVTLLLGVLDLRRGVMIACVILAIVFGGLAIGSFADALNPHRSRAWRRAQFIFAGGLIACAFGAAILIETTVRLP